LRFPTPSITRYGEIKRGEILINEIRAGESIAALLDSSQSALGKSVEAIAMIISEEIAKEFSLGFRPGFVITLIHHGPMERVRLSGTVSLAEGSFAGVPLEGGRVSPDSLGILITALAHEYSEMLLAYPDILHCSLYANAQSNRWAGEGVAEFVTSRCESKVQEAGFEIIPIENLLAPITISSTATDSRLNFSWRPPNVALPISGKPALLPATINLSQWTFNSPHKPHAAGDGLQLGLRYLAAEYVVSLWYHGAQLQGMEKPIAELAKWISYRSPGPSQRSLIQWMEATSGVKIASKVVAVSTTDVLAFHQNKLHER
jgi:hypothetical protein